MPFRMTEGPKELLSPRVTWNGQSLGKMGREGREANVWET